MNSKYIKSLIVYIFILNMIYFSGVFAQPGAELEKTGTRVSDQFKINKGQEIESKRTWNSKTYQKDDSTLVYEISANQIHFKDANDRWQDINMAIRGADDSSKVQVRDGLYHAEFYRWFNEKFSSSFRVKDKDSTQINTKLLRMGYYDTQRNIFHLIQEARPVTGVTDKNTIIYKDVFDGVDVKYSATLYGLKEEFILSEWGKSKLPSPDQFGIKADKAYLAFDNSFEINDDLVASVGRDTVSSINNLHDGKEPEKGKAFIYSYNGDKDIVFKNKSGKTRFVFSEDHAFYAGNSDSTRKTNDMAKNKKVWKKLYSELDNNHITTGVPYEWIKNSENGPVVIDPTIVIQPNGTFGKDNFICRGNGGNDNYGAVTGMQLGPDGGLTERRAMIRFDLTELGINSNVSSAFLNLYQYNRWGTILDFTIEAHKMLRDWTEGTGTTWDNNSTSGSDWHYRDETNNLTWNVDGMQAGTDYSSIILDDILISGTTNKWYVINITNAVQNWLTTPSGNYGLALLTAAGDMSKATGVFFRSSDYYATDPSLCAKLCIQCTFEPLAQFAYDAFGRIDEITYANGQTEENTYDAYRGWIDRQDFKSGAQNIFYLDNGFDNAGNITSQSYRHLSGTITAKTFGYDNLDRLKTENGATQYTYDANGNFTRYRNKTNLIYSANKLTNDGTTTYTFDTIGRVRQIGTNITINYDIFNNMTEYDILNEYHDFSYDAFNQRVTKASNLNSSFYVTSGEQILADYSDNIYPDHEFVYAGNKLLATLNTRDEAFTRPSIPLKVISKGLDAGYTCNLYVNGVDYSLNTRGYNIVIVDETTGAYLERESFDIWGSLTAADEMAAYINNIPTGRIVLAGISDDGTLRINENCYKALESIGSKLCRNVGYRASHAIVGRKGAMIGSVPEHLVPRGTNYAVAEVHKMDIRVKSAGINDGDFALIYMTNTSNYADNISGYNLVVLNESTGVIIDTPSYNTNLGTAQAEAMAAYINSIPAGRIVVVAVRGNGAANLTANAKTALASLGSAKCNSIAANDGWAMIGVKGAAVGTVPEVLVKSSNGYVDIKLSYPEIYLTEGYRFVYQDQVGSTRRLSNSDMTRDYTPFGETLVATGSNDNNFQYSQKELDTDIGLYYFGARYYNPALGRWYVPDPAGQGFSPYTYCGNNPLIYVDPDGEFWQFILAGAVIGGFANGTIYTISNHDNFEWDRFFTSVGTGALGGGLGSAAALFAPAGFVPGMLYGAGTGGLIGGITSVIAGNDFKSGFISGAIGGGIGGGIGGYKYAKALDRNPWTGGLTDSPEMLESPIIPYKNYFTRREIETPVFELDNPQASPGIGSRIPTTTDGVPIGYPSHRAAVKAFGKAGPGNEWHHYVLQHKYNINQFGAESIHNINNMVPIPSDIHQKITGFYNSINVNYTNSTSLRVYEWARTKSYQEQYQFGVQITRSFLNGY